MAAATTLSWLKRRELVIAQGYWHRTSTADCVVVSMRKTFDTSFLTGTLCDVKGAICYTTAYKPREIKHQAKN